MSSNLTAAIESIKNAHDNGSLVFGIRSVSGDYFDYQIGASIPKSFDYDIENDCSTEYTTKETLDGSCAVSIEDINVNYFAFGDDDRAELATAIEAALKAARSYGGDIVMIIAGETSEYGNDENEVIIQNATMIYKF